MKRTDVCIVGAGPGGAATALKLSYMNIPCILVDKAVFPRDKVCGDALSGKVFSLLQKLDPEILQRFRRQIPKMDTWGIRFVVPNKKLLDIPFVQGYTRDQEAAPGYVSRRLDFDNFLIDEVKRRDNIDFYEGVEIKDYKKIQDGYKILTKDRKFEIEAKIVIAADGANSGFSKKYAGLEMIPKHNAGAVRAYYKGVTDIVKDNFIELHFLKSITPGYFWIFPLPDGHVNVGVGMRTDIISKRRANLKKALLDIIQNEPDIKERFKNAEIIGKIKGFGLPFGSKFRKISGDHYMLVGDAAHLIDPLTGEGIGNAFFSGFIAAEQAEQCILQNNFSEKFLLTYDTRVKKAVGDEMQLSYKLQRIASFPWLLNGIANIIYGNQNILDYLSRIYTDMDMREKITKPLFWMKMIFKR